MDQLPQLIGAGLLLLGYGLSQTGRIKATSLGYNLFNLLGALLLLIDAVRAMQWGFIILEGAWVILTVPALYRALTKKS
ncbi:MAG: hypothetical protein IPG74_16215 [Flavobacteriales bacterium]|nr:hypothetical protein [Flavobacteriales bacterium]MBK7555223.1 hypothetical protein [Flavobacteriales bacterium]MBP6574164.1 hypothetical protein [Flavobacteriales bacterium]